MAKINFAMLTFWIEIFKQRNLEQRNWRSEKVQIKFGGTRAQSTNANFKNSFINSI